MSDTTQPDNIKIRKAMARAASGSSSFQTCVPGVGRNFMSNASVSVKEQYTKTNYDTARPSERVPTEFREILSFCNEQYFSVGIVRNVIDVMSDFCVKGIDWAHPNRAVQAFYRSWFQKINGRDVSERFCNYLLRLGNLCVYPNYSKISDDIATEWKKTRGSEFKNLKVTNLSIPSKYIFIDITTLYECLPEIGKLSDNRIFRMTVPTGLISSFSNYTGPMQTSFMSKIIKAIPEDLKKKIVDGGGSLYLVDGVDIYMHHYRRDDWESWSRPIIHSIAEPLIMLKKMHLADMSALDGAISSVRLWRVGYIDQNNTANSLIPSRAMLEKVRDLIKNNISGGVLDIIWGPDLDFKESASTSFNFLTPDKYKQVMSEIYDGIGINPSLAGGVSGDTGMTNNVLSLKVLVERLGYVRNKLREFWTGESKRLQKAMGFSAPAVLEFDDAIFSDEIQYKNLLLELYDRDVISMEGLREEFNFLDPVEASRIVKEHKKRENGRVSPKAGQFHDPHINDKVKNDLVKTGQLSGDEIGIDGVEPPLDKFSKQPGGRPSGSKDKTQRAKKPIRPRSLANDFIETQTWARENFDKITDIISPSYIKEKGKSNLRQLTDEEINEFEDIKLSILLAFDPFSSVDNNSVIQAISSIKPSIIEREIRDSLLKELAAKMNRIPTIEDKRISACAAYTISKITEN